MGVFTDLPDARSDETSPEFSRFPELCAKSPLTVLLFTFPALTALFQLQLFPVTKLWKPSVQQMLGPKTTFSSLRVRVFYEKGGGDQNAARTGKILDWYISNGRKEGVGVLYCCQECKWTAGSTLHTCKSDDMSCCSDSYVLGPGPSNPDILSCTDTLYVCVILYGL